jgi:hypothetical protein
MRENNFACPYQVFYVAKANIDIPFLIACLKASSRDT